MHHRYLQDQRHLRRQQNTGCMLSKRLLATVHPEFTFSHSNSQSQSEPEPGMFHWQIRQAHTSQMRHLELKCYPSTRSAAVSTLFLSTTNHPVIFSPASPDTEWDPGHMGSLADSEGFSFQGMSIPRTAVAQPFDMTRRKCSSWAWR
jgi:hypothetical protein